MVRIATIVLLLSITSQPSAFAQSRLLVFAAASLKNVLEKAGTEFEQQCHCTIVFSFAASGTLARQIEAGAPADIFVSADTKWMGWLRGNGTIRSETIQVIAGNRLVVAVSNNAGLADAETATPVKIGKILDAGRIAMAETRSVPAGRYGKQALETLGLWHKLSGKIVYNENVRVSLSLVARQDVNAAIVYFSDAKIEPRVKIAHIFKESSHDKILYPAGLVTTTIKPTDIKATEFMDYLTSKPARDIFKQFGFTAGSDD
ncbi:MAG: molybdate ABC transporter substrate-binding protein [Hyphomicrobiales bacterium]|nr:molybdate ABC transporter substrate-binding protein [Hyphomicrobiales bacterium]